MIKNDVEAYLGNQGEFLNLAENSISLTGLVEAVGVLEKEINALWGKNKKRLQLSRDLYNFMNKEGLDRLTEVVDRSRLKGDREVARKHYPQLDSHADEIIDLKEKLNDLQLLLFNVTTMEIGSVYGEKYMLEDPPPPDTEEICDCGNHKRNYKSRDNQWSLWEYVDRFPHGAQWVPCSIDGPGGGHGFKNRPGFPCEPVKEPSNGNNGSAQADIKDGGKKDPDMAVSC